jgi:hypothetical protein
MLLPSAFARAKPAWVRSIRRSRSNSATAAITAIVILPAGLVRSTPPRAQAVNAHADAGQGFDRGPDVHGIAAQSSISDSKDLFGVTRQRPTL